MKKSLSFLLGLMVILPSCSSDEPNDSNLSNERADIELSSADQKMVVAQREFAFRLFKESVAANGDKNTLIAPMSVYTCLSMMANGGDEQIVEQLAEELGATDLLGLNNFNSSLYNSLTTIDKKVQYLSVNSAWSNPGVNFLPEFTSNLKKYYRSSFYTAPLYTQQGVDQVNTWVSNNTKGLIQKALVTPLSSEILIANVNYFKGLWSGPFDKSKTKDDIFHSSFGDQTVDMMTKKGDFKKVMSNDYYGAQLDYGNGAYRMTVVMSNYNQDIRDFVASFDSEDWGQLKSWPTKVNLFMPRFKLETTGDIFKNVVAAAPAFDSSNFGNITGTTQLMRSILHTVVLEVDEAGTEAAAFTGIPPATSPGDGPVAPPQDIHVDRPFMFVIDEVSTGAILFMGTVNSI